MLFMAAIFVCVLRCNNYAVMSLGKALNDVFLLDAMLVEFVMSMYEPAATSINPKRI